MDSTHENTHEGLHQSEQAHDILRESRHNPMQSIFRPRHVALIGASEAVGSVGAALARNLAVYGTNYFPVNPRHAEVFGRKAFAGIADVPHKVDLAVIATPASTVPALIRECVDAGVKAAIIISAGFREVGADGVELERQVLAEAERGRLRIVGPNCLGVMSPHIKFNATFASETALPGGVAFISQSGALCSAILDWSLREKVGFSAFVSVGSMLDVGWGDLIDWLADDPLTKSIVIYMESVGDARAFLSAAREVALTKPVIVIKVGHTEAAAHAAASHTGALTGSDAVLDAAFRRAGVLRVATIGELFNMAEVLAKQPRPLGPKLAIITNAGGPGALATDLLVTSGGQLAPLAEETLTKLDQILPPHWSHGNPVDILGDASAERYASAIEIVERDPNSDGSLVILTPQSMTDPTATAAALVATAKTVKKPLLASWMGGPSVSEARRILNDAGLPTFNYPDTAARVFALMWRHSKSLSALYETPSLTVDTSRLHAQREQAANVISAANRAGRTLLTKLECNTVLAAYDIPIVETLLATSEDEAVQHARQIGFPTVVKLHSNTITHKTDVGGVKLDLRDEQAVRRAWQEIKTGVSAADFAGVTVEPMISASDGYELILGSSIDPQFGPVLLFGAGGQLVEVLDDHAIGLPPLTNTLARRLIERTRIVKALKGVRGRAPVDLDALEQVLVRFSQLIIEHPRIKEIDINPLQATPRGLVALDARMVLQDASVPDDALPKPAIQPYPVQHVSTWKMRKGESVTIRPIRPEDEPLIVAFHQTLSERSVYYRYFSTMKLDQRIAHERLSRICFIDYDREMALVVERKLENGGREIIAVGRLSKLHGIPAGEFAILVNDSWQGNGLGTELLSRLVQIGREEKLLRITADMLPENSGMQAVARKVGFTVRSDLANGECHAELAL